MFEIGKELKVVEYDKFGKPRNEEDLIELNRIISGQALEAEEINTETKAEEKARKKKEKADKKVLEAQQKLGYEDKEKKD